MKKLNLKPRSLKKITPVAFVVLFCILSFAFCAHQAHADITTGLVSWWKFDDGSGTSAIDSSGTGNTGTLSGSTLPTWVSPGKIGTYDLSFDGVGSYVDGGTSDSLLISGVVTASAWVKTNVTTSRAILAKYGSSGRFNYWLSMTSTGKIYFLRGNSSPDWTNSVTSNSSINDNKWHLVVARYDGANMEIYIDGVYDNGTPETRDADAWAPFHFCIGRIGYYCDIDYDNPWSGSIDDVRIYNRALSASDVAQLYAYTGASVGSGMMTSSNYEILSDSLNFGGGYSTSTNYIQESTGGEVATGISSSTNYIMSAGYQQMNAVALSLVPPSSVTMSPAIGGVTGGTSNGSTNFTVTTDDPAGYTSTIQASSSPALVDTASSTNAFADYTPAGLVPDFTFSIAPTASAFAFSAQGGDADQLFKNDTSVCNNGTNSTAQTCWDGLSTSPKTIADRTSNNTPAGTQTTLYFRAASGMNHIQASGVYVATTTLTVLPQ